MINFQTQQKIKDEFLAVLKKIDTSKILDTFIIKNENSNLTQEQIDFISAYSHWLNKNKENMSYLLKNNLKAQEKSSFLNQFLNYPNPIVTLFLDIPKIVEDDMFFGILLQKYESIFQSKEQELKDKLLKSFFTKYLNLIIANPIKPLEVIEDKSTIFSNKTQFLLNKFEKDFLNIIEKNNLTFNSLCEELFNQNVNNHTFNSNNNTFNTKLYETAKNKLLRNLPIQFHEKFLETEENINKNKKFALSLNTDLNQSDINDVKIEQLKDNPLSLIYLLIKLLEENQFEQFHDLFNHHVIKLNDTGLLEQMSKNAILLSKKQIQYFLSHIKDTKIFSFNLLDSHLNLKNDGFKHVFPIEKLKLIIDHLKLESISHQKIANFYVYILTHYDISEKESECLDVLNSLKEFYKNTNQEIFVIFLDYEKENTYVKEAPNAFEQILINLAYEDKIMPLNLFEFLLEDTVIASNEQLKYEQIIPLYSLSFKVIEQPILAIEKLTQKLHLVVDNDYEGSLEDNMLVILALCDSNFLSYSDIATKILDKKLYLPLSHKTLSDLLIQQKMKALIEKLNEQENQHTNNIWNNLNEHEKSLYLSMRKVQNKIEKQQQSMVMEMEDLVKAFEPYKVKTLNLPTLSNNNPSMNNNDSLMSLNLENIYATKNHEFGEGVITLENINPNYKIEIFTDAINQLENPKMTEKVEQFFYAKESVKKWIDTQDVINKKLFYLDDSVAKLSPALYAKLILEDEMLTEGLLFLNNQTNEDLIIEFKNIIHDLLQNGKITLEEKLLLNKKMDI